MESSSLWQRKYIQILVGVALAAGIFAMVAFGMSALKQAKYWMNGPVTIAVDGNGEVQARPDIGSFNFGVRGEGVSATEAQSKSAESINSITAFLKESGVEDKDVKTSNYNLNPKYRYEERPCPLGSYCPPGEQIIDGYEAYQMITVKVRNLEKAGELISGVGERGASDVSGLTFTIDDTDVLKAEAREAAIADAKMKADTLAKQLGVKIVKMISYYEDSSNPRPEYYGGDMMENAMFSEKTIAPELPVGEQTITSKVNITYEVK